MSEIELWIGHEPGSTKPHVFIARAEALAWEREKIGRSVFKVLWREAVLNRPKDDA